MISVGAVDWKGKQRNICFFIVSNPAGVGKSSLSTGTDSTTLEDLFNAGGRRLVQLVRVACHKKQLSFQLIYYGTFGKQEIFGNFRRRRLGQERW